MLSDHYDELKLLSMWHGSFLALARACNFGEGMPMVASFLADDSEYVTLIKKPTDQDVKSIEDTVANRASSALVRQIMMTGVRGALSTKFRNLKAHAMYLAEPVRARWEQGVFWTFLVTYAMEGWSYRVQYVYDDIDKELYPNTDFEYVAGVRFDLTHEPLSPLGSMLTKDLPTYKSSRKVTIEGLGLEYHPEKMPHFLREHIAEVYSSPHLLRGLTLKEAMPSQAQPEAVPCYKDTEEVSNEERTEGPSAGPEETAE